MLAMHEFANNLNIFPGVKSEGGAAVSKRVRGGRTQDREEN